jgi:hypothetical protein
MTVRPGVACTSIEVTQTLRPHVAVVVMVTSVSGVPSGITLVGALRQSPGALVVLTHVLARCSRASRMLHRESSM